MVRRHFQRQMLAFRNPGLHSFAEKKSKWEKVGRGGKRWEKAGNPALNPEESAVPSRLFPLPARFLSLEFCVLGVLLRPIPVPNRFQAPLGSAPRRLCRDPSITPYAGYQPLTTAKAGKRGKRRVGASGLRGKRWEEPAAEVGKGGLSRRFPVPAITPQLPYSSTPFPGSPPLHFHPP